MRQAILLRASLIPYIYSHARYAYDEGTYAHAIAYFFEE